MLLLDPVSYRRRLAYFFMILVSVTTTCYGLVKFSFYTAELAGRGKLLYSDPCNSFVRDYLRCCEGNYLDLAAVFLAGAFFFATAGAALL